MLHQFFEISQPITPFGLIGEGKEGGGPWTQVLTVVFLRVSNSFFKDNFDSHRPRLTVPALTVHKLDKSLEASHPAHKGYLKCHRNHLDTLIDSSLFYSCQQSETNKLNTNRQAALIG